MSHSEDGRSARTAMPPGYTPPVIHAPVVTCWRCHQVLDPTDVPSEVLHLRGLDYAVHAAGTAGCVPTLHNPHMPMPRETP